MKSTINHTPVKWIRPAPIIPTGSELAVETHLYRLGIWFANHCRHSFEAAGSRVVLRQRAGA